MAMFPDDFPFTRREQDAAAAAAEPAAPVVEAQPLAADAFPDDFPFAKRQAQPAPAAASPAVPSSSIFPPGFPFSEPEPAQKPVAATPEATEVSDMPDVWLETIAPAPGAPIAKPMPAPASLPFKDRRRSPRQRLSAKATLRIDNVGGNPLHVEIDNLSLLGVRVRTDRELLVNDKANLRLEVGPLKWATRLRVINCIRHGDAAFTVGCEFVGNELARGRAAA